MTAPVRVFVAADGNEFMHDIASWFADAARLAGRHAELISDELPAVDLVSPADFAAAVKTSVAAFVRLARNHTDFVRQTSAARLNEHGHPRSSAINDRVKIRVPPSHQMMLATGRKSSHLASWRGPMTIIERLSDTGYSMTENATGRAFQRAITNILPCRATSNRSAAVFDPAHADPFVVSEILAIRDDPDSPVYVAKVVSISADSVSVQCYGCTTPTSPVLFSALAGTCPTRTTSPSLKPPLPVSFRA